MKVYHFKYDIPKANLQIAYPMNEIPITGETYSQIVRQQFTLYYNSSCPLLKD